MLSDLLCLTGVYHDVNHTPSIGETQSVTHVLNQEIAVALYIVSYIVRRMA